MLRTLIIDDEPPARARLKRMLDALPECEVCGEAGSGQQALEKIRSMSPDLLLLDISMPGMDGMTLARTLKSMPAAPLVVFCTAWPDQALQAFDCDAIDYLVKPIRSERLKEAIAKAGRMIGSNPATASQAKTDNRFLRATVAGKTLLVNVDEIICLVAEDKYTTVHLQGAKTVINDSLVDLEQRFPEKFMRVHRNTLVAPRFIRGLEKSAPGASLLHLAGTDFMPEVSRRKLSTIRKFLRGAG